MNFLRHIQLKIETVFNVPIKHTHTSREQETAHNTLASPSLNIRVQNEVLDLVWCRDQTGNRNWLCGALESFRAWVKGLPYAPTCED